MGGPGPVMDERAELAGQCGDDTDAFHEGLALEYLAVVDTDLFGPRLQQP